MMAKCIGGEGRGDMRMEIREIESARCLQSAFIYSAEFTRVREYKCIMASLVNFNIPGPRLEISCKICFVGNISLSQFCRHDAKYLSQRTLRLTSTRKVIIKRSRDRELFVTPRSNCLSLGRPRGAVIEAREKRTYTRDPCDFPILSSPYKGD